MSIASEITRINNNIASAYSQCQSKGATMPATQNSANLANTISTISGGGGADLNDYFNTTIDSVSTSSNQWVNNLVKRFPPMTIANGITSLEWAFYKVPYGELAFDGLDCSNITSISSCFANVSSSATIPGPTKIDFANIINTNNITNARYLVENQKNLTQISNLISLTGNCDVRSAFYGCSELKKIDLTNWNLTITSSANLSAVFRGTSKVAVIDMSSITINIGTSTLSHTFNGCGTNCLQSDGAYADGIPYVYVKDATAQAKVLGSGNVPSTWSTSNVVIKSS